MGQERRLDKNIFCYCFRAQSDSTEISPIRSPYLQAAGGGPVVLGELYVKGDVQVALVDGALEVGHTLANNALDLSWLDHASCGLFYVDTAAVQVCQQNL